MISSGQIRRNVRKQQINTKLSTLSAFVPLNSHQIHLINRSTSPMLLHDLIRLAQRTTKFTIDTEKDYYSHVPALIQIEFIRDESIVLLIETCHLPGTTSVLFWLLKSLLKFILNSSNMIFSWGDIIKELTEFCPTQLFTLELTRKINNINIQDRFKDWCDQYFSVNDYTMCIRNELVLNYAIMAKRDANYKWSLQMATAFIFNEFINKSKTKHAWSRSLDSRLVGRPTCNNRSNHNYHSQFITYATNDCLAVTKLLVMLDFDLVEK